MTGGFLDANIIVRYLTGVPADLAAQAARIVDSESPLLLADLTLAEAAFVLTRHYNLPRAAVVDSLIALVRKSNVTMWRLEKDVVIQALQYCRPSGRVSFADALLWAVARSSEDALVYSFDKRFPKDGIDVRAEP